MAKTSPRRSAQVHGVDYEALRYAKQITIQGKSIRKGTWKELKSMFCEAMQPTAEQIKASEKWAAGLEVSEILDWLFTRRLWELWNEGQISYI